VRAATPTPVPALLTSGAAGTVAAPAKKALFRVVTEPFKGTDGVSFLHTEGGEYRLGSMSPVGYVEQIQGGVARVRDGFGELVYVVGARATIALPQVPTPAPVTYEAGKMSARWEPGPRVKWAEAEEQRMKAEMERPIGSKGAK
jgi:hypothetical protein